MTKTIEPESIDAAKAKAFIQQDRAQRLKRCAERVDAILIEEHCKLSAVTTIRAGTPIEVRIEIIDAE